MKHLWLAAFDELFLEYLDVHPDSPDSEAEAWALERADERAAQAWALKIDRAREMVKNEDLAG